MGVVCFCFCSCACACVWSVLPSASIPFTTLGSHNRSCRGHHLSCDQITRPVLDARVSIPWYLTHLHPPSHHYLFQAWLALRRRPPVNRRPLLHPAARGFQLPAPGSRLQCWQPTGRQLTFWGGGLALHELRQPIPAPGAWRGGSEFLRVRSLVWSAVAGWLTGAQGAPSLLWEPASRPLTP